MAFPGIFRVDPPAPQPAVHTPIPGQGGQPPPGGNQRDTDVLFGSGLWPAADWPAQSRPVVVSPTFFYGNQPPVVGGQRDRRILHGCGLWPQLDWDAQRRPIVSSPAIVYGDQPPLACGDRNSETLYGAAWRFTPQDWPAQRPPQIVPLTFTYGDQPPPIGGDRDPDVLFGGWQRFALTDWPAQQGPRIAPFTLVYGQQPPPYRRYVAYCPPLDWPAQVVAPVAAITPPPIIVSQPYAPGATFVAIGTWPQPDWPAQTAGRIAPLTLIYGQQPPPLKRQDIPQPVADWPAQAAHGIAPFVSLAPFQPYPPQAVYTAISAWPPTDWQAQTRPVTSSPAIVYGNQPPPFRPYVTQQTTVDWPTQMARGIAPLISVVAYQPCPPAAIYVAINDWPPVEWRAQARPVTSSPALVYGNQPTPQQLASISVAIRTWPQADWYTQSRSYASNLSVVQHFPDQTGFYVASDKSTGSFTSTSESAVSFIARKQNTLSLIVTLDET